MTTPSDDTLALEWDFFDLDGAIFRRPKGRMGGVTDVFLEKSRSWRPYQGADKTKPWMFGDRCADPLAGS